MENFTKGVEKMYNLERMREDIDLKRIIPYIVSSDEIRYAGSTMYCKCVSGLHSETRIEHNAVSEKFCHCFSCGESNDAFSYIKKYYAQQGLNISFSEICEKIGDALGGADLYVTDTVGKKKKMILTTEEMELIGVHTGGKKGSPSLLIMYGEEPEKIKKLLKDRAYESMMKNRVLSEQVDLPELKKKYLELYQKCRDIYEVLGGEEKSIVSLFRL